MVYPYTLPSLPYAYDALEPYIDAKTMEIHLHKHHQAYIDNLNKALLDYPDLQKYTLHDLITNLDKLPEAVQTAIRNHGGGHLNHSMFWQLMKPKASGNATGPIADAIVHRFGSFNNFKDQFTAAAKGRFGSGWAWLVLDAQGDLTVVSTANQDSPLSAKMKPVLGLDVWEHAYYLKYQSRRPEYIEAWWNVVNWEQVNDYYQHLIGR